MNALFWLLVTVAIVWLVVTAITRDSNGDFEIKDSEHISEKTHGNVTRIIEKITYKSGRVKYKTHEFKI
jgi:membrane protein implicated in regulation of membrane protease activity